MSAIEPDRPKFTHLDAISTRWATIGDPLQFVMRYAEAIRKYLMALIPNPADAEDVSQDFLANVLQRGFAHATPDRGRFRKYLKTAIRNAALLHFRRQKREQVAQSLFAQIGERHTDNDSPEFADDEWAAEWRRRLLDRTWAAMRHHQRKSGDTMYHTALKTFADHAAEDSTQLADRVSAVAGQTIRPDAFRQMLSRARRVFAELLVHEVSQTLADPSADDVEAELIEIGLLDAVRRLLPDDWKTSVRMA